PEWRSALYRDFLDELADVGATDVQLVVQWSQRDIYATEIGPLPGVSVEDELLEWVITEARARELRVFLMPILHLQERKRGHWRGKLRPDDWDAWWRSYREFILHYALMSKGSGVDLLSVGSELISTESRTERWRALIADVRQRFPGKLTYSANWDHFEPVAFWDDLDVAGITGYQELSDEPYPDEQTLVRGFAGLLQRIELWHAMTGQRFVFTEIGYPSQIYSARYPWDYRKRGDAPDLQLQLRCYRALYQVWQHRKVLDGLYVWNWFGVGGPTDHGYTPRDKPAASVLRHWFAAPATAPSKGSKPGPVRPTL
ncbi:MAG: hypothetical protein OXT09_12120, partial [Myxococcales bacterium]|nr:hypothetical protein [Myxococcales bacterium]